jgi:hypothetical protein
MKDSGGEYKKNVRPLPAHFRNPYSQTIHSLVAMKNSSHCWLEIPDSYSRHLKITSYPPFSSKYSNTYIGRSFGVQRPRIRCTINKHYTKRLVLTNSKSSSFTYSIRYHYRSHRLTPLYLTLFLACFCIKCIIH